MIAHNGRALQGHKNGLAALGFRKGRSGKAAKRSLKSKGGMADTVTKIETRGTPQLVGARWTQAYAHLAWGSNFQGWGGAPGGARATEEGSADCWSLGVSTNTRFFYFLKVGSWRTRGPLGLAMP